MKKIKKMLGLVVLSLAALSLVACDKAKTKDPVSRVQIDVNPSVELLVDENNVVVSVAGLNDDGLMIVAGEDLEGKKVDEACSIIIDVMTKTGFILKASATSDENEIKISITSNADEIVSALNKKISDKINNYLEENDIKAKISNIQAKTKAEIEKILLSIDSTITAAQAQAMSLNELYKEIAVARIEQAELYSQSLIELYNSAKEYEIKILEKEETAKVINTLDTTYQTIKTNYSNLINSIEEALQKLEKAKYDNLIDPECTYQKEMMNLKNQKINIVKKQNEIASMESSADKIIANAALDSLVLAYNLVVNTLDTAYNLALNTINALASSINQLIEQLETIEAQLPDEIKTILTGKTAEIEKKLNEAKTNFFNDFEKAHKDDITRINSEVLAYKESLKKANE